MPMKKIRPLTKYISLLTMVISISLSSVQVQAYQSPTNEESATLLATIGVFKGSDKGFELERQPTRIEGLIMLIRLLGAEDEAYAAGYTDSYFTDVPTWALPYTNYAFDHNLTKGIGNKQFGTSQALTLDAYSTYILRALGYDDSQGDFSYQDASKDLDKLLFLDFDKGDFTRGDLAAISYETLYLPLKGSKRSLLSSLILSKDIDINYYSTFNRIPYTSLTTTKTLISSIGGQEELRVNIDEDLMYIYGTYPKSNYWSWINYDSLEQFKQFTNKSLSTVLSLKPIIKDAFLLDIYLNNSHYGQYTSWVLGYKIKRYGDYFAFEENPIYLRNKTYYDYYNVLPNAFDTMDSYSYSLDQIHDDDQEIITLANDITAGLSTDYDKLKAIHQWVTANIYYDYSNPGLITLSNYDYTLNDALLVLHTKKGICEGYANLSLSLLKAIGIDSRKVSGNINADGNSFYSSEDVIDTLSNHSWYEAYVDGSWVICDPTFDSTNKYQDDSFQQGEPSLTFFDVSLESFSETHQILDYR